MKLYQQEYGYNCIPEKEKIEELYSKYTQQEIADLFGTYKTRVRKWLKHYDIAIRPPGGGNNKQFEINKETLQKLVAHNKITNRQIAEKFGCSISNITRLLKKFSITRNYNKTERQKYITKVYYLTEKIYAENIAILNPDNKPRTLCGVSGGYQVDHINPVINCFREGITPEISASISNLQFIPWEENLKRRVV
jgi:transposase